MCVSRRGGGVKKRKFRESFNIARLCLDGLKKKVPRARFSPTGGEITVVPKVLFPSNNFVSRRSLGSTPLYVQTKISCMVVFPRGKKLRFFGKRGKSTALEILGGVKKCR